MGEAVGIIAAQSIGEPGTQLTMRTFHTGGVSRRRHHDRSAARRRALRGPRAEGRGGLSPIEGVVDRSRGRRTAQLRSVTDQSRTDSRSLPCRRGWDRGALDDGAGVKDKTAIAEGPNGDRSLVESTARSSSTIDDLRSERARASATSTGAARIRSSSRTATIVTPGQQLTDGAQDPQQILLTLGRDAVQRYIIDEVQKVYRSQGVNINDKHIEVICRQMLRKVSIDARATPTSCRMSGSTGSSSTGSTRRSWRRAASRRRRRCCSGSPRRRWRPIPSWSAASFQETTRVLTEAAINGKVDHLRGLKENVIIGKLIPAGSGFGWPGSSRARELPLAQCGAGRRLKVKHRPGRRGSMRMELASVPAVAAAAGFRGWNAEDGGASLAAARPKIEGEARQLAWRPAANTVFGGLSDFARRGKVLT